MKANMAQSKKPSLWIASELYYPELTSTGYILTRIAEELSSYFNVGVICGQPSYSERGTQSPQRETHNDVDIHRCWATTLNKDVLLFRLVNILTITMSIFLTSLRHFSQGDHVLVVTNPPSLPFAVTLACKIRGAKCSLIVHDIYPDVAIASGKLLPDSMLAKFLSWLNIKLYRSMQRIFVLGRDMQDMVAEQLDIHRDRVVIATNWADLDLVVPTPRHKNALLCQLGITDKFVLLYAGNMGYPNDIESIIEAAIQLQQQRDIHFLFIGSGAKQKQLELAVSRESLSNVTLLDQQSRSKQSDFLNACDVALISLVAGMKGVSVPSRTYNVLASGKPIIGIVEDGTELALVIEEEGVGWIVPPGQPGKLVTMILEAKSQPELLHDMGLRARHAAEKKYTFQRVVQVFRNSLQVTI